MRILFFIALTTSLSLADINLSPTLHFNGLIGDTSASSFEDTGGHAHDPNANFALQGLDLGLNLRVDDWFAAFVNRSLFTTSDHRVDSELEEAFVKFKNFPGGFEIRGGRFLNRLGLQNNRHLHSWNFVNANLSTSQILGDEGLITEGIELTWQQEFDQSFLALTASYGKAAEHPHDEDHNGHDHESSNNARFSDDLITARALFGYNHTDFQQHLLGLNAASGDNGYHRDSSLHSIDYTYTWRENGLESGGRSFSVGAEYFHRDVQWSHPENPANRGSSTQNGLMAFASYRFTDQWIADLRYEHLQGRSAGSEIDMGKVEYAFASATRDRFSVALSREFEDKELFSHIRLQYSHDDTKEGKDDSIWLQFGFDFGQGEVR